MVRGVTESAVLFASGQSHYCRLNVAGWLGLGEENVVEVSTHLENDIQIDLLEGKAREVIQQGKRIAAFVATMGTTDAFGIDDLEAMVALRDRLMEEFDLDYKPHVHADAVIGWGWAVFNDYDFEENPLGFRPRTVRALAGATHRICKLNLADSIGIDFHKTGLRPLRFQSVSASRPPGPAAAGAGARADALPFSDRGKTSWNFHARNQSQRQRGSSCPGEYASFRSGGIESRARTPGGDGGTASRTFGGTCVDHGG